MLQPPTKIINGETRYYDVLVIQHDQPNYGTIEHDQPKKSLFQTLKDKLFGR